MLNNIVLLPLIFFPVGLSSRGPLFLDIRASGVVAQVVLAVISVVFTVTIVLSLSVGIPSPALVIAALVVYIWLATKLQGKELRKSVGNVALTEGHEREEWLFVNGICTTGSGAQLVANRLQQLFGRPVTAVLNRSLGIFFDLLECILQRDLFLTTPDIRIGYSHVRRAVMNPAKKRVVLIGHSQGGIIVSAWVDQLLCDFPDDVLAKVEVYTFASAANHFSRPSPTRLESAQSMPFAHVEHFANNGDFVSQFGVLSKAPQPPGLDATNATATLATLKDTLSPLPPIPHLAPLPNFAASAVHLGGVPFPNNDSPQRTLSLPPPPRAGVRTGSTFGRTISNAEPPERILDMGAWSPIGNGDTLGTGTFGTERQPGFTVSTERQSDLDFTQRTRTRTRTMHGPSPSVERYIPPFDDLFERTFDLAPPFEIAHIRDSMVAKDRAEAAAPYYHQNASTFSISM
ncbi:uncharacterized protein EHS24_000619 [Apiotrichum porosum]|uniref:DUF676 domain-containing protein n=1 Tax=Apiotrichum porosum TaxID=105984 RepID=A0A427YAG4_9TREE|nr:uncharacterized protein EHS24_000619 [Apiotrichum porosum]RSH88092.1 hypothetical protein EHS24_000619 [Apiotrichum porosum]